MGNLLRTRVTVENEELLRLQRPAPFCTLGEPWFHERFETNLTLFFWKIKGERRCKRNNSSFLTVTRVRSIRHRIGDVLRRNFLRLHASRFATSATRRPFEVHWNETCILVWANGLQVGLRWGGNIEVHVVNPTFHGESRIKKKVTCEDLSIEFKSVEQKGSCLGENSRYDGLKFRYSMFFW